MTSFRFRRALGVTSLLCTAALAASRFAVADPPRPHASDAVPDPGKGLTNGDDTSAIAINPANLAFLPGPELRWGMVWTGAGSPLPNRGNAIGLGVPIGPFATGLRLDLFSPPAGAPAPFDESSRWIRWAIALGGPRGSVGTTFGWSVSDDPRLGGYFSVTSGITSRPFPWLSIAAIARDWNEPVSDRGLTIPRSWGWGLGLRPLGSRSLEAAFDIAWNDTERSWLPKATVGVDVPSVGRLRGDLTVYPESDRRFLAMAGLEVNISSLQVAGGGVFGDAVTNAGAGFYFGAAMRGFQEPGLPLPARVVKVKIDDTPGVRGHIRLLRKLWRIADDPEVEGVVLQLRAEPASSLAHAEEVADAIRTIRARKKKVLCHLEDAGGRSLFVCSQADRIAMNPAGGLRFSGVASQYLYFGGLLKKLGVRADFVRIGAHKLAAEQLTTTSGSDVGRVDHQELVDQFEQVYLHDVGGGRRIPLVELKSRIAKGPFLATEAKAAGLLDTLAYEDEIDRVASDMMGAGAHVTDYEPAKRAPTRWSDAPKVAVIYLSGDMVDGESQFIPFVGVRLAGSATIVKALRKAREDASVKSIVFRVGTGGGSSLAADVILREAILTARAKPLVVSMGTSAASGGYYAAVAGRTIFANRATVTGSIGIFYGKVDVVGLLDKLGVKVEQFRSAPRADAESLFRPFTDDERGELGVKVKQFYDMFIARVAEGRKMKPEDVDAVARGKVWTGAQAHTKGLVDRIGGFREALAEARMLGGLADDAPIVELPVEDDSLIGFLLKLVGISAAGVNPMAAAMVPPAFLQFARALAPFMIFEPSKALARAEFMEDVSLEPPEEP